MAEQPIATWEKHTKGIGSKLLKKFGFTGRLGAKEDGVSRAIEVVVRPTGQGLGFGDFQEASALKANKQLEAEWRGKEYIEEAEEGNARKSSIETLAESRSWKKGKGRPKAANLSIEEMLKAEEENRGKEGRQVIIDMRYETARVITDMSKLSEPLVLTNKPKFGQEILFNIDSLAEENSAALQGDIRKLDVVDRSLRAVEGDLQQIEAKLVETLEKAETLSRLEQILGKVEENLLSQTTVPLKSISQLFVTLFDSFRSEFFLFGLVGLLPQLCSPAISAAFMNWNPFSNPYQLLAVLEEFDPFLKHLELSKEQQLKAEVLELLTEQIQAAVVDRIRRSIVNDWIVSDVASCVQLIETCVALFPPIFVDELFRSCVLPKLQLAVESWEPSLKKSQFPDVWLLPWVNIFGAPTFSELFPTLRRKFRKFISSHGVLSDSATLVDMLSPWKGIFDAKSMSQLLITVVMPKLVAMLRDVSWEIGENVDLVQSPLLTVAQWAEILPEDHYELLIQAEVLRPYFKQIIRQLDHTVVPKSVLKDWCEGLSEVIEVTGLPLVMLDTTLNAVLLHFVVQASAEGSGRYSIAKTIGTVVSDYPVSYFEAAEQLERREDIERRLAGLTEQSLRDRGNRTATNSIRSVSFKEVVEKFAERHNVQFVPAGSRIVNDELQPRQLWNFGTKLCYIDQNVLFVQSESKQFVPTGLEELI